MIASGALEPDEPERRAQRPRRGLAIAGIVAALAILLVVALAAFPVGLARGFVTARLSRALGRPVTIVELKRIGGWSLHPVIALRGLSAPQAPWAGPGDLVRIREARVSFPVLPLLLGRFRPERIDIDGLRLNLARDAAGRENWSGGDANRGSGRPTIRHLTVRDSFMTYRDAKRGRNFAAALSVDSARGLLLAGKGDVLGHPVSLRAVGGAIDEAHAGSPWPFRVAIEGDAVGMTLDARADAPLDLDHFSGAGTGHGDDLKLLDALIEAGLPGTQPVRIAATIRRDRPTWTITRLRGTIGRSDISGDVTVSKTGDRHDVTGTIVASAFDFDDLANAESRSIGAAARARSGPRLIPDTRIDLSHLAKTDGTLHVRVARLLWPGPSPLRALKTTITLDHGLLTVDPLSVDLPHGTMAGRAIVDQRVGGPKLTVALDIAKARLIDIIPAGLSDGALTGRIRLTGRGATIREAIGASDGAAGFVARDGRIPERIAALLGEDVGGAVTASKGDTALRCMIARLAVTHGVGRISPLLFDTSRSLSKATGTVDLATERLALSITGAPKRDSLLRYAGAITMSGTIKQHVVVVPRQAKSAGGLLKMLGRGLTGRQAPTASDVDCDALARAALR